MLASKHVRFWCQYQTRTLVLRYPCIPEAMAVANDDEWDDETYARQQEGNGSGKSRRTKGDRKVCCTGSQGLSKNIHEYTVIFAEKLKQMFVLKALQLCKTDSMKHMGQTNIAAWTPHSLFTLPGSSMISAVPNPSPTHLFIMTTLFATRSIWRTSMKKCFWNWQSLVRQRDRALSSVAFCRSSGTRFQNQKSHAWFEEVRKASDLIYRWFGESKNTIVSSP